MQSAHRWLNQFVRILALLSLQWKDRIPLGLLHELASLSNCEGDIPARTHVEGIGNKSPQDPTCRVVVIFSSTDRGSSSGVS